VTTAKGGTEAGTGVEPIDAVRILLVDDDEDDYEVTRGLVREIRSFRSDLYWERTYDSGLIALRRQDNDVCLLDYRLGARTGLELLADARDAGCTVPIIFLTGQGERYTDDLAMKCGADDYLLKTELTTTVLERSIRYALERARHIDELRKSEQRYRHIVETTNQGVWMIDTQGRTTFMNARMASMLGYARDEVAGVPVLDFVCDEGRDAALQQIARSRQGSVQTESRLKRKDGSGVWVLLEASPIVGESGTCDGSFAMVMDITERKTADDALRLSVRIATLTAEIGVALTTDDMLRAILQRCCDVVVKDLDVAFAGLWTYSAATRAFEWQASAGTYAHADGPDNGLPVAHFNVDPLVDERRPLVASDVENDARISGSEWARREGMGSFAEYPLVVGGELVGAIIVFSRAPLSDVALRGLASIADAIGVRIRGKLAEQAKVSLEMQLLQAQKMEAVGRLAGGIAHDFNNILSVILSYSDLLIDDLKEGDPIRNDIDEIRRAGMRATELTRQLLMFSRQQVIAPKVLNLNDLLTSMDKMLRRVVGEDVVLTSIPASALGRICADPGSIEQVIMNLVVNARDAMPTGGRLTMETADVELDEKYVRTHLGANPGRYVMLSVSDTGIGIDKTTLARIFEPFFTTKETGKGTGLGLSTVFGIVHQTGGNIWVYSEPGQGTTFKIYFPRIDATSETQQTPGASATQRGSETVLLVEDEGQVRVVASGILKRYGYTVVEARDAEDAVLLCRRHPGPIHLLLTDVVMPQMSGPQLAKRLLLMKPEMKVLCMSGYTDDAAVRHGVIAAELAYLQKPLTVETLTRKVREVLDARPVSLSVLLPPV
jgi:two-component system cell cycle sensor histidine kinase/response regulator CckA